VAWGVGIARGGIGLSRIQVEAYNETRDETSEQTGASKRGKAMADEQQARDAEAALHLTNELLASVDVYISRQPGGEMPVAVVADGVAGLAGSVAASGVEQLRAAGEGLDAEQLPLEMC
jgi:hypothetical protein